MDGETNQLCHFMKQPGNRLHGMPLQTMPVTVVLVVAPTSVGVERRVLAAAVTATVGNLAPTRHSIEYQWSEILVACIFFFSLWGTQTAGFETIWTKFSSYPLVSKPHVLLQLNFPVTTSKLPSPTGSLSYYLKNRTERSLPVLDGSTTRSSIPTKSCWKKNIQVWLAYRVPCIVKTCVAKQSSHKSWCKWYMWESVTGPVSPALVVQKG